MYTNNHFEMHLSTSLGVSVFVDFLFPHSMNEKCDCVRVQSQFPNDGDAAMALCICSQAKWMSKRVLQVNVFSRDEKASFCMEPVERPYRNIYAQHIFSYSNRPRERERKKQAKYTHTYMDQVALFWFDFLSPFQPVDMTAIAAMKGVLNKTVDTHTNTCIYTRTLFDKNASVNIIVFGSSHHIYTMIYIP